MSDINQLILSNSNQSNKDLSDMIAISLEYSSCFQIGDQIQEYIDELKRILNQHQTELNDKISIAKILVINFNFIGKTLETVQNYLNSSNVQLKLNPKEPKEAFIKLTKDKMQQYFADQKELLQIGKLKEISCLVTKLPAYWKCLLWRAHETLHSTKSLTIDTSCMTINNLNTYECEIDSKYFADLLSQFRRKIDSMKLQIAFWNEIILWLYDHSRDYMKVFVKIEKELAMFEDCNEATAIVRNDIFNVFNNIENKIDLFSNSEQAYEFATKYDKLRLKLK